MKRRDFLRASVGISMSVGLSGCLSLGRDFEYLDGISGGNYPQNIQEHIEREHVFNYSGNEFTYTIAYPKQTYEYYKNKPNHTDWGVYNSDLLDNATLSATIDEFSEKVKELGGSYGHFASLVAKFARSIKYTPDIIGSGIKERPKFPVETLVEQEGDCEDQAVLISSLLENAGHKTLLLPMYEINHMGLAVEVEDQNSNFSFNGKSYDYLEPTVPNYPLGVLPEPVDKFFDEYSERVDPIPMGSRPSMTLREWETEVDNGKLNAELLIENDGLTLPKNSVTRLTFRTPNENLHQESVSKKLPPIYPGEKKSVSIETKPPNEDKLGLGFEIWVDNRYGHTYLHARDESEIQKRN